MNIDKGEVTGSLFIDLAKAFHTVDHEILISKLKFVMNASCGLRIIFREESNLCVLILNHLKSLKLLLVCRRDPF